MEILGPLCQTIIMAKWGLDPGSYKGSIAASILDHYNCNIVDLIQDNEMAI
jgi:hypothetical protein